jgi:hypothetical protein
MTRRSTALPLRRDLTIVQGATFRRGWEWRPGNVPMDLAGCTARMQIRAEIDSEDVLLELTTENGRITLGAESGAIDLRIEAEDTAAIAWDSGVYDLEIELSDGTVERFAQGSVVVSPEVTR